MTLPNAAQAACPNYTSHTSHWKHISSPTSQNTIKTPSLSLASSNSNLQIYDGTKIKIFSKLLEEQNKNNNKVRKRSMVSLCLIQFIHGSFDQFFTIVMIWSKFSTCNWQHGRAINTPTRFNQQHRRVVNTPTRLNTCLASIYDVQFQFMIPEFQGYAWQGNEHLGIESFEYTTKQGDQHMQLKLQTTC